MTDMPFIPRSRAVSSETKARYRETFLRLQLGSIEKRWPWPATGEVSFYEIVQDLLGRTDLLESTRQTYGSALLWHLRAHQNQSLDCRRAYQLLSEKLAMNRAEARRRRRFKPISEDDLQILTYHLKQRSRRSRWAQPALFWLLATHSSGTRPIEWLFAEWADSGCAKLKVLTAKEKWSPPAFFGDAGSLSAQDTYLDDVGDEWQEGDPDREGDGDEDMPYLLGNHTRQIPIIRHSDREAIEQHMAFFRRHVPLDLGPMQRYAAFQRYRTQCQQVIRRACLAIWGGKKPYSLYSMRGQFAANSKAWFGTEATAVSMGHCDPRSPSTGYYGKGNQAHSEYKGRRAPQYVRKKQSPPTETDRP